MMFVDYSITNDCLQMGFLDALRKRSSAVRFSYSFKLHVLSPWPASGRPIAVAWQRGSKKKKRGLTAAHRPRQVANQLGTAIEFNDVIQISATLYMEGGEAPSPSGPFKKKCLILAIIETGSRGQDATALGRVVIDLAEFASMQSEVKKEFPVACSRNIVAAVGEPILTATVKCMWKSSGGPASMASSMSSDRTGGTFTTNFNAFIRGSENEHIPVRLTGEQFDDLRGFDRLRTIAEAEDQAQGLSERPSRGSGHVRHHDDNRFVIEEFIPSPSAERAQEEIQVEETFATLSHVGLERHEREMSRESGLQAPEFAFVDSPMGLSDAGEESGNGADRTGAWLSGLNLGVGPGSPTNGLIYQLSDDMPIPSDLDEQEPTDDVPQRHEVHESASSATLASEKLTDNESEEEIRSSSELLALVGETNETHEQQHVDDRLTLQSPRIPKTQAMEASEEVVRKTNFERRWRRAANSSEDLDRSRSPSPRKAAFPGRNPFRTSPDRSISPINRSDRQPCGQPASLLAELRSAAFLEYSVYLARPGPHKYTMRNVHAPARRIARGLKLVRHNKDESVSTLQACLQAIRVMVESCSADVPGMAFWWGNCFQLRLLLSRFDGRQSFDSESSDHLIRRLQQLIIKMEKTIFDRLQQYLWWKIFVPHIANAPQEAKPSPYNEGGVQTWLCALYSVYDQFSLSNSPAGGEIGHLHLLRRKIIGNCCRMMDNLLFRELLSGATKGHFHLQSMDNFREDMASMQPPTWTKVHPGCLPFKKGPLTFGVGMHLKMAVTRWSEWAIEANMKEPQHTGDPGQSFFPSLKASGDLLMMPKELLTDASVRGELFAALSIRSMCILLERFQPDEFAPDPVNPEILRSLTTRLGEQKDSAADQMMTLQEPPFEWKYDGSESEMDISFDSDSEAEMETMIRSFPSADNTISRFELLKDQWLAQKERR